MNNFNQLPQMNTDTEPEVAKYRKARDTKKKRVALITIASVFLVLFIVASVFVIQAIFGNNYDKTSRFYFSSDILTEKGDTFTVYEFATFKLYNYADSLRTSAEDIDSFDFKVICEKKDITSKCTISCEKSSFSKGVQESSQVKLVVDEKYYSKPLQVTVTSNPVNVQLKGTFTIMPKWDVEYFEEEPSVYGMLTLSANKLVSLNIKCDNDELICDKNNDFVRASTDEDSFVVTLNPGECTNIVFFKKDITKSYSADSKDFPIKIKELDDVVNIDFSNISNNEETEVTTDEN